MHCELTSLLVHKFYPREVINGVPLKNVQSYVSYKAEAWNRVDDIQVFLGLVFGVE